MSDPIIVPAAPTAAQLAAAIRQVIGYLGTAAGVLGLTDAANFLNGLGVNNAAATVIGFAATVVVFVWGQIATRSQAQKLATAANAAPNSVAQIR